MLQVEKPFGQDFKFSYILTYYHKSVNLLFIVHTPHCQLAE